MNEPLPREFLVTVTKDGHRVSGTAWGYTSMDLVARIEDALGLCDRIEVRPLQQTERVQ